MVQWLLAIRKREITHDNLSLTDPEHPGKYKKMPILGDLHEVLMRKEECRRMANILNRLVSGSASSFNQQTNVDLENNMLCWIFRNFLVICSWECLWHWILSGQKQGRPDSRKSGFCR